MDLYASLTLILSHGSLFLIVLSGSLILTSPLFLCPFFLLCNYGKKYYPAHSLCHNPILVSIIDSLQMRTAIHSLSGNQIFEGKSLASKQGHQEYKPPGKKKQ